MNSTTNTNSYSNTIVTVWVAERFDRLAYVFGPAPFQASAVTRHAQPNCKHKQRRLVADKARRELWP